MPSSDQLRQRPKVLQCVTHLALGGAERVALTLVEALRNDFDFEIFAVRGIADGDIGQKLAEDVRKLGLPLHIGARIPMRFGGVITSGIGMARVMRRVKPDLVHLHTEIPEMGYAVMAAFLPKTRRVPVVRTIHNTIFWEFWRRMGRWADQQLPRSFIAGVSPGATEAFIRLRKESGGTALPQSPVTIYNGVQEPKAIAKSPKKDQNEPIKIVFGGRFEDQKGTDLIPQILAQVRPPSPAGAHLLLFGSGAHEPQLQTLAKSPPPGWKVEVRRPIPNFSSQLNEYDLVIMPSRYEGLALVSIEASLAGTPVIATDIPGLKETLPLKHPWLALTNNTQSFAALLQQALDQPESWTAVAEASRSFARGHFTVNTMAAAYSSLYHQALAAQHR